MQWLKDIYSGLQNFVYFYPLVMAWVWMIGALFFYWKWERPARAGVGVPRLKVYPPISYIVPCHNEEDNVEETIRHLAEQNYPHFEIIAVNDGSRDNTAAILDRLAEKYPALRVVHLKKNQGKAMGLRTAALMARNEFLICIDGDAALDPNVGVYMMRHFLEGTRVGAVTGNPRVRNRASLLGKIQVGEFSASVGMIKRAQRVYGKVFTVSGVIAAFRKTALHQIGYWNTDMITEDIDVSWRLQLAGWDIRFEPNALCWIWMPETLKGLWRQRLRWAQGGAEVLIRYWRDVACWSQRRMWAVFLDSAISVVWAYTLAFLVITALIGLFIPGDSVAGPLPLVPGMSAFILCATCLVQFVLGFLLDARYERGMGRIYYWVIWYPMAFWAISAVAAIFAFPKALRKRPGTRAVWVSPDRGWRT